MTIYLSLLICLVGLVLFFKATNPKWVDVGLVSFGVGLLAFLLGGAHFFSAVIK